MSAVSTRIVTDGRWPATGARPETTIALAPGTHRGEGPLRKTVVAALPKNEVPDLGGSFEWRGELSDENSTITQCPPDGAYKLFKGSNI